MGYEYAWGLQDDQASIEAIHLALTDWSGQEPYIFTKCGRRWDRDGKIFKVLEAESIRRECEDSLRRLRVDAIDFY